MGIFGLRGVARRTARRTTRRVSRRRFLLGTGLLAAGAIGYSAYRNRKNANAYPSDAAAPPVQQPAPQAPPPGSEGSS